jgi:drug/metabolite transporter (DMT)-like permease
MFGFGAVLLKFIAGPLDQVLVTFFALLIGGLFTALVLLVRRQSLLLTLSRSAWINVLLLASLGTALPLLLVIIGLSQTSAIRGGFLLQLQGPVATILACLMLGEKLVWKQWTGTALLIIGSILVAFQGPQMIASPESMQGNLSILAGTLGFGYSFIPAKRLTEQTGPLQISVLRLFCGACLVFPLLFFQSPLIKGPFSWPIFWMCLLYGVTNFCLGYILLQEGLRLLPAWESAAILQTVPLFTTVFALLLSQDMPTFVQIIGGIIAIVGGIIAVT